MVHGELEFRLNDREYKNWLKAGRCLLILKDGLHPFVNNRMRAFHRDLLNKNSHLRTPCETSSCKPRANKLSRVCRACSLWQTVILSHHRQPDATVNWDNCSPPSWRTDHWELAKVIRYRNELMHSCDFRVRDDWMRRYQTSLTHLVRQFSNVPEMAAVEQQINDMLSVDLSIYASGQDQMDSADSVGLESDSASQLKINADLISQWEAELLQERLQELLHAAAAPVDDDTKTLDAEQLMTLGGFLKANRDLAERFSAELQAIDSLKA
ncbi:uncharacterized protein CXorf38 homolog isoform X2 [Thunnus albacares]|uniref:uncharacterized protein CXorf38 homolog isoform X2 n=1 Tax=Thunnus albacares TaxID=8236 RepID=UPI001CF66FC3|nr:uncharacterized protein CXorf38 homolog isoform X2 [Thunnus albacares]